MPRGVRACASSPRAAPARTAARVLCLPPGPPAMTVARTRRPFTTAQALSAAGVGALGSTASALHVRGATWAATGGVVCGVLTGVAAAWILRSHRGLQVLVGGVGSLACAGLLVAGAFIGSAGAQVLVLAVGAAVASVVALCPSAQYRRAGGLCVAAAALLGLTSLAPRGLSQWGLVVLAVLLLLVHRRVSPEDWSRTSAS